MTWLARLFWAVLAILFFLLAALAVNQSPISLQFLKWQTPELSVFWWLLAAFGLGLLVAVIGYTVLATRLSLRNRKLTKQLGNAEQELRKVRNLALHE
jgi:uncharacterized membrane protein YciS (DUF1049 family)